jgi:LuxR family maltose regulon positive regulatory protein
MDPPLLQTKLYIPPVRPEYVSRPRLRAILEKGLQRKLTLLSAPAGYGKTSLVSAWASRVDIPCAWISLDRYDNDLLRFLGYLTASLGTIRVEVDKSFLQPSHPEPDAFNDCLVSLINQVTAASHPFILVLDDYHHIQNEQVHQVVMDLLNNLPANMHLLILSRIDPPLRLAKLRAMGALCEIRAEDLRFNQVEALAFFNHSMKLGLEDGEVASLIAKTEGWIAGLQLAAVSLQGSPDKGAFLTAFAGDNRYIADYLVDEALARQPLEVQDFLQQTAILDRLCASLCDAVILGKTSQEILNQLDQANLFIIRLDDMRVWYRYHHLFQDLLLHRLRQNRTPDMVADLHLRASDWHLANKMVFEAIRHAFACGDMLRIVRLVESHIFTMLDRGGMRQLLHWLDSIPEELKTDHPWLNIAHALALVYTGDLERGENALILGEQSLGVLDEKDISRANGFIGSIRAYVYWMTGKAREAGECASRALDIIPQGELGLRAFATMVLGGAHINCYDHESAHQALKTSIDLAKKARNAHIHILASSHLVYLLTRQAQLTRAEQVCREIFNQYQEGQGLVSPAIAQAYALMAEIFSCRLELDQALSYAQKGLEVSRHWDQIDTITLCHVYLAEVLTVRGEYDRAQKVLEEVKALTKDISPWFRNIIEETEIKNHLAAGNIPAANRWAEDSGQEILDGISSTRGSSHINFAKVLVLQGKTCEASQLLGRLIEQAEKAGMKSFLLSLLTLQSLALFEMGDQQGAQKILRKALAIAEPEGYIREFVRTGKSLVPLLQQAYEAGIEPAFVVTLLEAIPGKHSEIRDIGFLPLPGKQASGESLIEPLSRREIEVLRWMAMGCTNQEIAQELVLSLHTAKTHARNIYSKLGAKNRTEAVARARLLGLLTES